MSDGGAAGGGASGAGPWPPRRPAPIRAWGRAWRGRVRGSRPPGPAAIAPASTAFAAGLLAAAVISQGPNAGTANAWADKGGPWSLFGKPRAAGAARPGAPRPQEFAVWRTRIDTSGAEPR